MEDVWARGVKENIYEIDMLGFKGLSSLKLRLQD